MLSLHGWFVIKASLVEPQRRIGGGRAPGEESGAPGSFNLGSLGRPLGHASRFDVFRPGSDCAGKAMFEVEGRPEPGERPRRQSSDLHLPAFLPADDPDQRCRLRDFVSLATEQKPEPIAIILPFLAVFVVFEVVWPRILFEANFLFGATNTFPYWGTFLLSVLLVI
ncbi:MAG: hypothetical protein COX57_05835 [Alphaproteobacteria bacterium CG_4_10_14_0_2_um_filter_63_37]|nr:MAG: hypothetical protein COX57_05835 [Alphaproteobacteria bacterium CG_4_10_14_0_2_um_filter_63_37]